LVATVVLPTPPFGLKTTTIVPLRSVQPSSLSVGVVEDVRSRRRRSFGGCTWPSTRQRIESGEKSSGQVLSSRASEEPASR
jgi:hypothetical protein